MEESSKHISNIITSIHDQKPLVHHMTNMVVMNDTANITLAVGALPVMASAIEEVEEMVSIAGALVLNIGTLTPAQVEAMIRAGKRANERNIPIVLDPVGAGATRLRTESALRLLAELKITTLRGNASEIATLVGVAGETRGVESIAVSSDIATIARTAAKNFKCVAAITGVQDVVTDGAKTILIDNGHPLLATITGSGCMATSMIGAFLAVERNTLIATAAALVAMGIAGELAAPKSGGPGTFRSHLLDAVSLLDATALEYYQKVSIHG